MKLNLKALLQTRPLINGKWVSGAQASRSFPVVNPATAEFICSVDGVSEDQAEDAIKASAKAFESWSQQLPTNRSQILQKLYSLMVAKKQDLALIITAENGKPIAEALGEVQYAANYVQWFAEECKRVNGDILQSPMAGRRLMVIKQPVGPVSIITPWNFPLAMISRKVAPALASGCTAIVKPASETPLSALALGQLALEAGVPDGVLQILTSSHKDTPAIGELLVTHPLIRKFSFTGSTPTGKHLAKLAMGTLKRISLELGGHAPFIIFPDFGNQSRQEFLSAAADGVMAAKFRNAGQTCVAANVIYVHKSIREEFASILAGRVDRLKVGNGSDQSTNIGPLISDRAHAKIQSHVDDAQSKGARVLPTKHQNSEMPGALFYPPTILDNCNSSMLLASEETFGPILPIAEFESEQDVISKANESKVGLAAYFFSRDIGRIWRVAERLQVGMVGVNEGLISTEFAPFGGIKESGFGREGSKYGIDDYLNIKYICIGGLAK